MVFKKIANFCSETCLKSPNIGKNRRKFVTVAEKNVILTLTPPTPLTRTCDSRRSADLWLMGEPPLSDSSNCSLANGSGEADRLWWLPLPIPM
jgi:hypothetical protein